MEVPTFCSIAADVIVPVGCNWDLRSHLCSLPRDAKAPLQMQSSWFLWWREAFMMHREHSCVLWSGATLRFGVKVKGTTQGILHTRRCDAATSPRGRRKQGQPDVPEPQHLEVSAILLETRVWWGNWTNPRCLLASDKGAHIICVVENTGWEMQISPSHCQKSSSRQPWLWIWVQSVPVQRKNCHRCHAGNGHSDSQSYKPCLRQPNQWSQEANLLRETIYV